MKFANPMINIYSDDLPTDIGIRDALRLLGRDPAEAPDLAEGWRPWRSYAQIHLWQTLSTTPKGH